jgi:hypothetical protein
MRGVKFHIPTVLLIVVACVLLFCGGCKWTPEEKPAQPIPPTRATIPPELRDCLEMYAGQYSAEGKLASHPNAKRIVTLWLRRDWKATLTTSYQGSPHIPMTEAGNWRCDKNVASVVLTEANGQPQRNELAFELREGELVAIRFDAKRYGEGLKLKRQ